jgi:hypothetical protein
MQIGLVPMSAKPYHAGHHMLVELAAISEITDELKELELPVNDTVAVFVSFSGRGIRKVKDPTDTRTLKQGARKIEMPKPGKVPVFGADMQHIWTEILKPNLKLPGKVKLLTPDDGIGASPLSSVHDVCEALREAVDSESETFSVPYMGIQTPTFDTIINIYSDDQDIVTNYSDELMTKQYGDLWKSESAPSIRGVGVPRTATIEISGTEMRDYLCAGDTKAFGEMLPPLPADVKEEIANILVTSIELGCPLKRRPVKGESLLRQYIRSAILRG